MYAGVSLLYVFGSTLFVTPSKSPASVVYWVS